MHSSLRRWRPRFGWFLVFVWIGSTLVSGASPALATETVWVADPTALSFSVPLGGRVNRAITLTNVSGGALRPQIYTAHPPAATLAGIAAPTGPRIVALPEQEQPLDPELLEELRDAEDGRAAFFVYLDEQADLSAAYAIEDWEARGQYVYRTLYDWAEEHQREVRAELEARGLTFQPFWITNALLVEGTRADAQALAARADVALVRANHSIEMLPEIDSTVAFGNLCSPDQPNNPICWNVRRLGADRVWREFGINGSGIVVANVDTGVRYDHPGLLQQYRGYQGSASVQNNYNWFDPQGVQATPFDYNGHGTHTMGTIVGAGRGTSQPAVGVAPGAQWIAAQGCENFICDESDLIASAQWLLAPTTLDGTQPRPDLRPLIVNNSWASRSGDRWYAGYTAAWRAAGIFPVFAAGNAGAISSQVCGSIASPGDYPDVLAVGATDFQNRIAAFSLIGPTRDNRMKPDFVAPGTYASYAQGVLSTVPSDLRYDTLQGTSMAAPAVAGVVALLWQANPALIGDYDATYRILANSARRISDTRCGDAANSPNSIYGNGLVDAYRAVRQARVSIPWINTPAALAEVARNGRTTLNVTFDAARVTAPGTYRARLLVYGSNLTQAPTTINVTMVVTAATSQATVSGRVVSSETGTPVQASIRAGQGMLVEADRQGNYSLTLPHGSHELVISAPSFATARQTIQVTGNQRLNLRLNPDQPRAQLPTQVLTSTVGFNARTRVSIPISNSGTQPLQYEVQIPEDEFSVWRSDEPGGPRYRWVELPQSARVLTLTNGFREHVPLNMVFPFYGFNTNRVTVTAHGMLAFDRPFNYDGPTHRCLPDDEFNYYLIAPFRADLNPAKGGRIRYATQHVGGTRAFIVSYERVALHTAPDQRYTFQVLLFEDGRILYQYRDLGRLPSKLSVGLQRAPNNLISVGCGTTTPVANELAIELRPQPITVEWIRRDVERGTLRPGQQGRINLSLEWLAPQYPNPYRGQVVISSNDPLRPVQRITIDHRPQPAPYQQWLTTIRGGSGFGAR